MVFLLFDDFHHFLSSLEYLRERLGLAANNSPKLRIDVGGREGTMVVATSLCADESRPM